MGIQIDVYSHHFIVSHVDSIAYAAIEKYARSFIQMHVERDIHGNITSKAVYVYATRSYVDAHYRFHITLLSEFKTFLKDNLITLDNEIYHPVYEPAKADIKIKSGWEPREDQKPVVEYLVEPGFKKVVDAATGVGKTAMSLFSLSRIGQRVGMVIKPMYIDRWLDALIKPDAMLANVTYKDVVIVKGSKALRSIFLIAQSGELNYKFIIISNRTLAQYYQHYKENGEDEMYANVKPENMWELLGVGVRLIDEAHEMFFSCFQCDLHTNVPKSIELSGTLNPDDPFLKRMYEIMYPLQLRMNTGAYVRYIDLVGLTYGLRDDPKPVSTRRRGKQYYSQAAYEESIYKQPVRMKRLHTMIAELVEELFIVKRLPEHKLLIFFETVNMCTAIADNLQKLYPELKVSRYTQEEDSEVLQTHDIIVATPASAGTAVDIAKLQQVISFVMRGSTQSVIQMVGRLRQLKTDELKPTYNYLFTREISTHNAYSKKMEEIFKYKALTHSIQRINYEL